MRLRVKFRYRVRLRVSLRFKVRFKVKFMFRVRVRLRVKFRFKVYGWGLVQSILKILRISRRGFKNLRVKKFPHSRIRV